MKKKYAVILNPVAGKGKALNLVPVITEKLEKLSLDFEIFLTERPWHAAELAREAEKQGFSAVVAAGGDGTCNEVINGLMPGPERPAAAEPPVLGVLPVGRGNDFAYGAGIPPDLDAACKILAEGNDGPLDVGRIRGGFFPEGRYFGNGIGIGFDTIVGLEAAGNKYLHGPLSYLYGALKTLIIYPKAPAIDISFNGVSRTVESQQISILNGRRMGGMFFMAPDSDKSDGAFDLCMAVRPMTRTDMIGLILHYIKGTQDASPIIETSRAEQFSISAPKGGLVCHADGETICTDGYSLEVECIPSALRIHSNPVLPAKLKHRL